MLVNIKIVHMYIRYSVLVTIDNFLMAATTIHIASLTVLIIYAI